MAERNKRLPGWIKWVLIAAGWTLYGFFFASEVIVSRAYAGRPLKVGGTLEAWLICAAIWFAATPFILKLARRFPLERRRWLATSIIHILAATVLSFVLLAIYVVTASLAGLESGSTSLVAAFRTQMVLNFHSEFLTYWMVIGLHQA